VSQRSQGRYVSVGIATAILVGAAIGGTLVGFSLENATPGVSTDGPTLYGALHAVVGTVQNQSGGPWELFSTLGIAAESTFNPAAFAFGGSTNLSIQSCGDELNGVTVWNGSSIPLFDGSIASGTAPFWQFEFFSSPTKEITIATDVSWVVHVYPPIPPTSSCWIYSGGESAPEYVGWVNPLPEDSSVQATLAYDRDAESFAARNSPMVELFANGYSPLNEIGHGPYGGVELYRCGIVGVAGVQPYLNVGFSQNGQIFDVGKGNLTCTATYSLGPPAVYTPYHLDWSTPSSDKSFSYGVNYTVDSFLATFPTGIDNNTTDYDAWGLLTWMVSLSLRAANGTDLPSAPLSCQGWYPSPSTCDASSSGWSVMLLSANGAGVATFPSTSDASSWSVPDAPVVSQDQVWLTYPAAWDVSGVTLDVSGSSAVPTITGSLSL